MSWFKDIINGIKNIGKDVKGWITDNIIAPNANYIGAEDIKRSMEMQQAESLEELNEINKDLLKETFGIDKIENGIEKAETWTMDNIIKPFYHGTGMGMQDNPLNQIANQYTEAIKAIPEPKNFGDFINGTVKTIGAGLNAGKELFKEGFKQVEAGVGAIGEKLSKPGTATGGTTTDGTATGGTTPGQTQVQDNTNTNISEAITGQSWEDIYKLIEDTRQQQWAREDQIRKETQEREDTAYQRAVADMRKAGINPNLVGINPANSGGGITSATGNDYTPLSEELKRRIGANSQILEKFLAEFEIELEQGFEETENKKDRSNVFNIALIAAIAKTFL